MDSVGPAPRLRVGWAGVVVKLLEAREESNVIINTSGQHGGSCERKGNGGEREKGDCP